MTNLTKACFVSLSLLLIGSAAQAQSCITYKAAKDRIGAEHDIAIARRKSLINAPKSEYCAAARYEDALFDKWNEAYKRMTTCMCRAGYCEGMMDEYSDNLKAANKNRALTNKACN